MSATVAEGPRGLPRLLEGMASDGETMTLADHKAVHGPLPDLAPVELIELVHRSGLRGRGGADFPTAAKLRTLAERRGASTVIVNGSETEPASAKDRMLLARLPHLVIDGAVLAAAAIGASEILIKIGDGTPSVQRSLEGAVAVREERFSFEVITGPEGYVTGEETAVIQWLTRGVAKPVFTPPRPFEKGLTGPPDPDPESPRRWLRSRSSPGSEPSGSGSWAHTLIRARRWSRSPGRSARRGSMSWPSAPR